MHIVDSLAKGRKIQYQLFEQKPVDAYDRIQQRDYKPRQVVDQWVAELRRTEPATTKRFKDGRYDDKSIRPRKYHFMVDEFAHALKNSPHVHEWIRREVHPTELGNGIKKLIHRKCSELSGLSEDKQRNYVNIPQQKNYQLFQKYLKQTPFQILPYVYYKQYARLVRDLEQEMQLESDESDEELSDTELSIFVDCK